MLIFFFISIERVRKSPMFQKKSAPIWDKNMPQRSTASQLGELGKVTFLSAGRLKTSKLKLRISSDLIRLHIIILNA